jgi:hypothetical protein
MELLIPGLILVALMAYASTRIKRSAARAYEAETIETEDFVIQKPDGFLNVVGGDPQYVFEAYSKDFGGDGAENIRLATAYAVVKNDASINDAANEILRSGDEITDDRSNEIDDTHCRKIKRRLNEKGVDFLMLSKLAARDGKVFIFTIKVIAETSRDFMQHIEAMFDSFELK